MPRTLILLLLSFLPYGFACAAGDRPREIIDPAEAAKDPDFAVQGEYVGKGTWQDGKNTKVGAQVIALGNGGFNVVVTRGGLPGAGWKRGKPRFSLTGKLDNSSITKLIGQDTSGQIDGTAMTIAGKDGKLELKLKRTVRHSPTEGAKPPKGAIVLFDGKTADNFIHGRMSKDKNLMSEAETKQKFEDYHLHLEFRLSYMPQARGQGRSNSGLYLHNCYEVQVLDSFGLEGEDNECGGFYQIRKPDVNMCFPPLTWQTYDVDFTAPKFKDGKKVSDARAEVRQNGVVIHPMLKLPNRTPGHGEVGPGPRPFYLQGHGNNVEYRNIWLVPKAKAD